MKLDSEKITRSSSTNSVSASYSRNTQSSKLPWSPVYRSIVNKRPLATNLQLCGHRHRIPRARGLLPVPKQPLPAQHETQKTKKMSLSLGSTGCPHPCVASRIGRALRLDLELRFEGGFIVCFHRYGRWQPRRGSGRAGDNHQEIDEVGGGQRQ